MYTSSVLIDARKTDASSKKRVGGVGDQLGQGKDEVTERGGVGGDTVCVCH